LDERRKCEASGFRNEIKLVQDKLRKSEQMIMKVVSKSLQFPASGSTSSTIRDKFDNDNNNKENRNNERTAENTFSTQAWKSLKSDLQKVKNRIQEVEQVLNEDNY
jgi:hypothetical protein